MDNRQRRRRRCRAPEATLYQAVLIVGETNVGAPTNAAVAANEDCVARATAAAVQLVVTLAEMPDAEVRARS